MATKKQVRARVAAQRAAFEEEVRQTGLQAQRKDRQKREIRAKQKAAAIEAEKQRQKNEKLAREARPVVATFGISEEDAKRIILEIREDYPEVSDRKFAMLVGERVRFEALEAAYTDNSSIEQECI